MGEMTWIDGPPTTWTCPRCSATCERSGLVSDPEDGGELACYQCEFCYVEVLMFGEPFVGNLTFCVNPAGRAYDPTSPDGALPPPAPPPAG